LGGYFQDESGVMVYYRRDGEAVLKEGDDTVTLCNIPPIPTNFEAIFHYTSIQKK
jgi:hypothetical protein